MTRSIATLSLGAAIALSTFGCTPELGEDVSLVNGRRVLAVRADPPEVAPGAQTTLTALYVDTSGTLSTGALDFTFCTAMKPLAELGPVASACLDPASDAQIHVGIGLTATGTVPTDTCSRFGPNPPPASGDDPPGRPTDADSTSGFYQPGIVFDAENGDPTLHAVRVRCGLGPVSQEVSVEWNRRARANQNPELTRLAIVRDDGELLVPPTSEGAPTVVGVSETVTLRAGYPTCPSSDVCGDGVCGLDELAADCPMDCATPTGCGGAERYLAYDVTTLRLVERREAVRVAWYATGGELDEPRTGRAEGDAETTTDNTWVAPSEPGRVYLWLVVRDDRGGTGFESYAFEVLADP